MPLKSKEILKLTQDKSPAIEKNIFNVRCELKTTNTSKLKETIYRTYL